MSRLNYAIARTILGGKLDDLRDFLRESDPAKVGLKKYENLNTIQRLGHILCIENEHLHSEAVRLRLELEKANKRIAELL